MPRPFTVLALAGMVAAAPAAAWVLDPTQGTAGGTACGPDGASTHVGHDDPAGPDVDGTMVFPRDGCSATYDLAAAGAHPNGTSDVAQVHYRVLGEGIVCGDFTFGGAAVGSSVLQCAAGGGTVAAQATTRPGSGKLLTVAWDSFTGGDHGAALCALFLVGSDPEPSPPAPGCLSAWDFPAGCLGDLQAKVDGDVVRLDWPPDGNATSYTVLVRQVVGTDDDDPIDAHIVLRSRLNVTVGPGTWGFVVRLDGPDGTHATHCERFAIVGGGSEVPFFGGAAAVGAGLAGVLGAGMLLARRRGAQ